MAQSKHDVKVKGKVNSLKRQGWKVKADVKGYDRPDPIGKYKRIPDIQAEKAGARKIIEVETKDTMQIDKKQQETFRKSAAQRKRTSFEIVEV
jgi:hypothetical protein